MKIKIKEINENLINNFKNKKLRNTKQRIQILKVFLSYDGHLTVDELYEKVKKLNSKIGYATVYRALKLFCEHGIAEGIKIDNQKIFYEHKYAHEHHDHLFCIKCGKLIEIKSHALEILQNKVAQEQNFKVLTHKLIIYGFCIKCVN